MAKKNTKHRTNSVKNSEGEVKVKKVKKSKRSRNVEGEVVVKYERRSFFWNALALLLAFVFGMIATLGTLIGLGYYAVAKVPAKDILSKFNLDYQSYITEDYANKSLVEIGQDLAQNGVHKLSDIGKVTPFLETQLNSLSDSFLSQLGVKVDIPELMDTKFSELPTYLQEKVVGNIELGGVLGVKADASALFLSLCYGKEGIDYTIGEDGTITMIDGHTPLTVSKLIDEGENIIMDMELGALLNVTAESDPLILSLCYGKEGINYKVEGTEIVPIYPETPEATPTADVEPAPAEGEEPPAPPAEGGETPTEPEPSKGTYSYPICIGDLINNAQSIMMDIEIASALDITAGSDAMMRYLAFGSEGEDYDIEDEKIVMKEGKSPKTLGSLTEDGANIVENAKIGDLIKVDEESSQFLQTMKDKKIKELADEKEFEKLTIGELIAINDDAKGLMGTIKTWTIGDFKDETKFESLQINQIISIDETSSSFLQAIQEWSINDMKDEKKIESLQIGQLIAIDKDADGLMKAIEGWTIGDMKSQRRLEWLKISQIITIDKENASRLMLAIADWRISDLTKQEKLDSLTLSNVLEINEKDSETANILISLKDTPLGSFGTEINELTINDILGADEVASNQLLKNLGGSTLKTLSNDLQELTIGQILGDDIYTYAKTNDYTAAQDGNVPVAKENKVQADAVTVKYYDKDGTTELLKGYFAAISDNESLLVDQPFYQKRVDLTPVYEYKVVNFEGNEELLTPLPKNCEVSLLNGKLHYIENIDGEWNAEIKNDGFCEYAELIDGEGNLHKKVYLAQVLTGYKKSDGSLLPEEQKKTVRTGTSEGGEPTYYLLENTTVTECYYNKDDLEAGKIKSENLKPEAKMEFVLTADGTTSVTRYHTGLWYVLLESQPKEEGATASLGADTPILNMASLASNALGLINSITLGDMYMHEILEENPDCVIPIDFSREDGTVLNNLNQFTISDTIAYIKKIGHGDLGGITIPTNPPIGG